VAWRQHTAWVAVGLRAVPVAVTAVAIEAAATVPSEP
jgi:hypothetical protein